MMRTIPNADAEKLLMDVVHDLRQPLGNIEVTAFHMNLLLSESQTKVLEQLRTIEQQVDRAARILSEAAAGLSQLRAQRVAGDSLALTNSASPVVT